MMTEIYRAERGVVEMLVRECKLPEKDEATMLFWLATTPELFVGKVQGKLVAVWGLVPLTFLSEQAYLWLYITDVGQSHKLTVARHSLDVVEEMLCDYPRLIGACLYEEVKSQRWLRWLGATFGKPAGQLIPFEIRRT